MLFWPHISNSCIILLYIYISLLSQTVSNGVLYMVGRYSKIIFKIIAKKIQNQILKNKNKMLKIWKNQTEFWKTSNLYSK